MSSYRRKKPHAPKGRRLIRTPWLAITAALATVLSLIGAVGTASATGGGNEDCPENTILLAKYEWTSGGYVAESGSSIVTVSGNSQSGSFTVVSDNHLVSAVVVKGATDAKIDYYDPPVSSGSFSNSGLVNEGGNTPAISNLQFCGGEVPDKPEPEVVTDKETRKSCEAGVESRTVTTTTEYVWNGRDWVLGEPVTTYGDWKFVRELTAAEKQKLDCDKPNKPEPIVEQLHEERMSCEAGVEERNGTKTTGWVFDENSWQWVKDEPVVEWGDWTFVRDLTAAEKDKLDCETDKPEQPEPEVVTDKETRKSCEAGVESRTVTTTTEYVWNGEEWVLGEPVTTYGDWTFVRHLTAAEEEKLDCGPSVPEQPEPEVVTDKETRKSCEAGVESRTVTTTTEYVWNGRDWVLGEPVTTYGDWKFVRELTDAEEVQLGCEDDEVVYNPKASLSHECEIAEGTKTGLSVVNVMLDNRGSTEELAFELVESIDGKVKISQVPVAAGEFRSFQMFYTPEDGDKVSLTVNVLDTRAAHLSFNTEKCVTDTPPPPPPSDVCPNLPGNQSEVPDDMKKNDKGNCVVPDKPDEPEQPDSDKPDHPTSPPPAGGTDGWSAAPIMMWSGLGLWALIGLAVVFGRRRRIGEV